MNTGKTLFAQPTHRESLRDIETCLSAQEVKLYHMGFREPVRRSTLADAIMTQMRIAVAVYVTVAIVKKRLSLDPSLYTVLQILSVTLCEKIPLYQALPQRPFEARMPVTDNQLNPFACLSHQGFHAMPATLAQLRHFAITRSLFKPTTLKRAIRKLGFVQADPIRAPARAQDLTLRHRASGYRAGDLERLYPGLGIEEDFFVNYGFMPRDIHALMHPRTPRHAWPEARHKQAEAMRRYVLEKGIVHPRSVDAHFAHGKTRSGFGGSSNASTRLLDDMHYRGLLRVARRESGIRLYEAREASSAPLAPDAALDALVDVIAAKYAPLPAASLGQLLSLLNGGAPQWRGERNAALQRAKQRLAHAQVEGVDWYWPAAERWKGCEPDGAVRLLAPFDPLVWDRRRFELFWGWAYRFEAYTPAPQRKLGYYALPLLWRDAVIGWGNVNVRTIRGKDKLLVSLGYASGKAPRAAVFRNGLEEELQRMRIFLNLADN